MMLVLAMVMALCTTSSISAASWETDLDSWFEGELTPYVAEQLTTHPRFKGETVMFVALQDGSTAPTANALTLALRDQLLSEVVDTPGVTIGWRPELSKFNGNTAGPAVDCTRDIVHYYIGLEVTRLINGRYRVNVRALDVEEQSWVAGFGNSWQGPLTNAQRRAFQQTKADEFFRGLRAVPFAESQLDLLAAHLAHDLTCSLLRQSAGEYVIITEGSQGQLSSLEGIVELVSNYLANYQALQLTTQVDGANAILQGKAHPIDAELYQYWITVTPKTDATGLPALSANAYVSLPDQRIADSHTPVTPERDPVEARGVARRSDGVVLSALRVVEPHDDHPCYTADVPHREQRWVTADYTVQQGQCFALQTRTTLDAVVFLLNYQVNGGLVNLSGGDCRPSNGSITAQAGEPFLFPMAADFWPSASEWPGQPGLETFYAVAVSDPTAARELTRLMDRLPTRCTVWAVPGLDGDELRYWLEAFGVVVNRWQRHVDWQAVRIHHVY